jgi:hypothetical protein
MTTNQTRAAFPPWQRHESVDFGEPRKDDCAGPTLACTHHTLAQNEGISISYGDNPPPSPPQAEPEPAEETKHDDTTAPQEDTPAPAPPQAEPAQKNEGDYSDEDEDEDEDEGKSNAGEPAPQPKSAEHPASEPEQPNSASDPHKDEEQPGSPSKRKGRLDLGSFRVPNP